MPKVREAWFFPPGSHHEASRMELHLDTGTKDLGEVWHDQSPPHTLCVVRLEGPADVHARIGFALA